jgi:hypothetical protein
MLQSMNSDMQQIHRGFLMKTTQITRTPAIEARIDAPVVTPAPRTSVRSTPVFSGLEDHTIALEDAGRQTRSHRRSAGAGAIKAGVFGRAAIEQVLAQDGVVGMRYYFGQESNGRPVMVIVGVDEMGRDLYDGVVCERSAPCPPFCGPDWNPLNS